MKTYLYRASNLKFTMALAFLCGLKQEGMALYILNIQPFRVEYRYILYPR